MKKIIKIMILVLMLGVLIPTMPTEAKTVTVTIKNEASIDKAVKTVHKNALKHKKMTLKIKGSKKSSEKLLEVFEKKLQMYNTYSVIINVEKGKAKKGYTSYTITKEDTKTYDYAIQYIKKVISLRLAGYNRRADTTNPDNYVNGNMENNFKKFANHKGWGEYYNQPLVEGATETFAEAYQIPSDWKEYLPDWQMFEEGKTFAELSTFQQYQMIGDLLGSGSTTSNETKRDNCLGTTSQKLKRMVDGKTRKMCSEYAKYSQIIYSQLDIQTVYQRYKDNDIWKEGHAWLFTYITDTHAESGWYLSEVSQGIEEDLSKVFERDLVKHELTGYSDRKSTAYNKYRDLVTPPTSVPKGHTYLH